MNFFRGLALALTTTALISCQHSGDSGPATGQATKDQIKGSWELVGVQDSTGKSYPASQSNQGIQLQIDDNTFTMIFVNKDGTNLPVTLKYELKGKRVIIDKSTGGNFPDYEIVSVSANQAVVRMIPTDKTDDSGTFLQVFNRIPESKLATSRTAHLQQTVYVSYDWIGYDKSEKAGTVSGDAEFRSNGNKSITCVFNGQGADRYLMVLYTEFTKNGSELSMNTDTNSMVSFRIPAQKFNSTIDSEEIDQEATGPASGQLYSINDAPNKMLFLGSAGSTCNFHVSRQKTSLQITGDCTGGASIMYKTSTISMKASCELQRF